MLAILISMAACANPVGEEGRYSLTEFAIDGPRTMRADADSLTVANGGEFPHTLVITDANGGVATATGLIAPGDVVDLDIELAPGTYQFTCRIVAQRPDGTIVDHFEEGMNQIVTVSG